MRREATMIMRPSIRLTFQLVAADPAWMLGSRPGMTNQGNPRSAGIIGSGPSANAEALEQIQVETNRLRRSMTW